jgi:hypothetical protein
MLLVRLRFPVILLVAFVVVGRWDALRNYWDTFTRAVAHEDAAARAVSNDTEYFCPMDPGVVADWPGKCGVCNMALVRRKRAEATALPDGIVARMQLTPYRVQLAGIQTAPVAYRPLERTITAAAVVPRDERPDAGTVRLTVEVPARERPWLRAARPASAWVDDQPALSGTTKPLADAGDSGSLAVEIVLDDPGHDLRPGAVVNVRIAIPIARVEPFRSQPSDPPALVAREARAVFACPDHAETPYERPGRCPKDQNELERKSLAGNQRLRWWCPMHPEVTAASAGQKCAECGGMVLRPRVITYNPRGQVLAVPESAVVDSGTSRVVFVERMPGMFEGVEIELGPRCGDEYPVVRGLTAGERVAVAGGFLLDAETRLNTSLSASYFGAGRANERRP